MPQHSPARVWALLGPHRGDNNQILALAEALGLPFEEKVLSYNQLRRIPAGLLGATFASVDAGCRKLIEGEPPDLTISTGLRSVPVVRELRRRSGGKTRSVHLGFPRISPKHFDLVVPTPEYPVPDAPNVMRIPFALTPHAARPVEQSDRDLLNAYPRPRRLFLVGGPTLYWELPVEQMTTALQDLLDAARKEGGSVLTVGSPRTPVELLAAIRQTLEASSVPFLFEPGDGPPAYPALIEAADEIFVTADSVAMAADAVMTGKPVGLVPIAKSGLGRIGHERHGPIAAGPAALPARPALLLGGAQGRGLWRHLARAQGQPAARLCRAGRGAGQAAFGAACSAGHKWPR